MSKVWYSNTFIMFFILIMAVLLACIGFLYIKYSVIDSFLGIQSYHLSLVFGYLLYILSSILGIFGFEMFLIALFKRREVPPIVNKLNSYILWLLNKIMTITLPLLVFIIFVIIWSFVHFIFNVLYYAIFFYGFKVTLEYTEFSLSLVTTLVIFLLGWEKGWQKIQFLFTKLSAHDEVDLEFLNQMIIKFKTKHSLFFLVYLFHLIILILALISDDCSSFQGGQVYICRLVSSCALNLEFYGRAMIIILAIDAIITNFKVWKNPGE